MSRTRRNFSAITVLLAVLAGCSTTPSNHYLLTASLEQAPTGQSPALGIGPIEIPEYLNRNTLVYMEGGHQLHIASSERWAEPLENGIARVLSLNLAGLLDTENVRAYPWHPKRAPDFGIKVRVLGLDAAEGEAILVAEWLVYNPGSAEPLVRKISQLNEPLGQQQVSPEALPPAYSKLLYRLSELIAEAVRAVPVASD